MQLHTSTQTQLNPVHSNQIFTDGEDLLCTGKGFHKPGATTEKALSPFDFNLVLGIWRIVCKVSYALCFDKISKGQQ